MEYKVEKFRGNYYSPALILPKNGIQEEARKSNKSTIVSTKNSTQFIETLPAQLPEEGKTVEKDVVLNLCPDGSKFSININGTTLKATRTSLGATIGCFTINIDSLIPPQDAQPNIVQVISITQGYPLHIVLGDSPDVKATFASSKFLYFLKSIIYFLLCMNS